MKSILTILYLLAAQAILITVISTRATAQAFIHPGIDQQSKDLALMKQKVLAGEQPWKNAFDRLQAAADTNFVVTAHTHVLRGPYGKPNIGGDDLSKGADMAYNYALVWYITNNKTYANKAISILNTWSPTLWDLDYNDAKLLAAWTGHKLCNAAEILKYTNAGWQQKDMTAFSNLLMTVYYPLLRPYYPQANGNWDGAIIHSLLAMAIFTDNRPLFDNAVDHFKHAPVNGSIFKYIYPNGQCQESPRDQGHVQLGLGEFAGAAQVAYTQAVDLFSIASNRIALGFEYTASFLLGEKPYCYCNISERAKGLRDDFEYVYRHYTAMGVEMPYSKRAADSIRPKASRSVLTSVRVPIIRTMVVQGPPKASVIAEMAGAGLPPTQLQHPPAGINVSPGQSIQQAIDSASANGIGQVILQAGIHTFPATLKIRSGITLTGVGASTILFLNPGSGEREAIINATDDLHDVTISNLVIEACNRTDPGTDPNTYRSYRGGYNRGGILFRAQKEGQIQRIRLTNITVRNATYSGVSISGGTGIIITNCDFSENGASVAPGPKLLHNLLLAHCKNVTVSGSRLVTSPSGSGIAVEHCSDISVTNCEIARNGYYGILIEESSNISMTKNLVEGNDFSGIMTAFLFYGSENIQITSNRIQFNNGYGVESYAAKNSKSENNQLEGNGNVTDQQKISAEKIIIFDK
ncbi:MAG: right-handed parallel beta-helix repeat-containing protein [Chitinophagaceae bacterium]